MNFQKQNFEAWNNSVTASDYEKLKDALVLLIEKAIVDDGLEDWKNVIPAPYDTNMVKACVQIFLIQRARFLAKNYQCRMRASVMLVTFFLMLANFWSPTSQILLTEHMSPTSMQPRSMRLERFERKNSASKSARSL